MNARHIIDRHFLTESYVNLLTYEDMVKWIPKMIPLILLSYDYTGGYKHAKTAEALRPILISDAKKGGIWKMSTGQDGSLKALNLARPTEFGQKSFCTATDGTDEGKVKLAKIARESAQKRAAYSELSGKAEKFYARNGYEKMPTDIVKKVIGDEAINHQEDGAYEREIRGERHKKGLYATPMAAARFKS